MAKSRTLSLALPAVVLAALLLAILGLHICQDGPNLDPVPYSATSVANEPLNTHQAVQATSNTRANATTSGKKSSLASRQLPPATWPSRPLPSASLADLLILGRRLAQSGDNQALQDIFGKALMRYILSNDKNAVADLLQILINTHEPAALRQTILEALVHTISALPNNAKADLFYQSLHILQYDNDPALRAAALRAASAFAIALRAGTQPLPAAATADLHRLALGYVDAQHEPPELRQAAICQLVTTYPSSDFPPKLLAILDSPSQHPAAVVRCAAVALTDLQHPSALPVMSHLLNQTDDQELFLTLAYSIAQFSTKEGLKTLVDNATRHESTCQPYIARQQQLIEDIITDPDAGYLSTAIKAIPLFPEQAQRRRLMKQAVNAILLGNTPRDPESVKALLSVVAEQGTPDECRMLITHIGENQQWQTEWQRVNDRSRAVTSIVVGYRSID